MNISEYCHSHLHSQLGTIVTNFHAIILYCNFENLCDGSSYSVNGLLWNAKIRKPKSSCDMSLFMQPWTYFKYICFMDLFHEKKTFPLDLISYRINFCYTYSLKTIVTRKTEDIDIFFSVCLCWHPSI